MQKENLSKRDVIVGILYHTTEKIDHPKIIHDFLEDQLENQKENALLEVFRPELKAENPRLGLNTLDGLRIEHYVPSDLYRKGITLLPASKTIRKDFISKFNQEQKDEIKKLGEQLTNYIA
ncbi:MAG: hypothetical protein V5A57_00500 [Candidatus Paceibacterota bacterium]